MRVDTLSVFATVIGAFSLYTLYKLFTRFVNEINNKKVLVRMSKRDAIRNSVLNHTSADSVTFFKTHSLFGKPSHSRDYVTTCVRGTIEEENKYRALVVDENYLNILLSIINPDNTYYSFRTSDELPCLLKTVFEEEGISRAIIYYIESTHYGISYVLFSKKDDTEFSEGDLFKFKEAIRKLKSLRNSFQL